VLRHHQRVHRLLGVFTKPNKGTSKSRQISSTREVRFGLSQVQIGKVVYFFVSLHCPRGHDTKDFFSFTLFFQVFLRTSQQLVLLSGPDFGVAGDILETKPPQPGLPAPRPPPTEMKLPPPPTACSSGRDGCCS
jgi:hypothetical protein